MITAELLVDEVLSKSRRVELKNVSTLEDHTYKGYLTVTMS